MRAARRKESETSAQFPLVGVAATDGRNPSFLVNNHLGPRRTLRSQAKVDLCTAEENMCFLCRPERSPIEHLRFLRAGFRQWIWKSVQRQNTDRKSVV